MDIDTIIPLTIPNVPSSSASYECFSTAPFYIGDYLWNFFAIMAVGQTVPEKEHSLIKSGSAVDAFEFGF
jgi:hypothetical protein